MFKGFIILLIKGYQHFVSPLLPNSCRFLPTCSQYSLESVQRFGILKGGYLSIKRLLKCHPFGSYGHDPVPCNPATTKISKNKQKDS